MEWEKGTPEEYEMELRENLQTDIALEIKNQNTIIEIHSAEIEKRLRSLWMYIFAFVCLIIMAGNLLVNNGPIIVRGVGAVFLTLLSFSSLKLFILPIYKKNQEDKEAINEASSKLERAKEICEERIKNRIKLYRRAYDNYNNSEKNDTHIYAKNLNVGSGKIITHDKDVNHFHFDIDKFVDNTYTDEETLSEILYQIKESNDKLSQLADVLEKGINNPDGKDEARSILQDLANIFQIIGTVTTWLNL